MAGGGGEGRVAGGRSDGKVDQLPNAILEIQAYPFWSPAASPKLYYVASVYNCLHGCL